MKKSHKTIFFFVLLLALILRIYRIETAPPSLNWDEVSHGYNAYSILKTGEDEWSDFLPFPNFRAYGDYPLSLNLYLTMPFIALFGLNVFSIRILHVLLGTGIVFVSYFLTIKFTKNRTHALLVMFLTSVSPWYVFLSRFVVQSNLSIFFMTTAILLFTYAISRPKLLIFSVLLFALSLFSYHTTRIFVPILCFVLAFFYKDQLIAIYNKDKKSTLLAFLFAIVVTAVYLSTTLSHEARARSKYVFLLDAAAINEIIESRLSSPLPDALDRLIYNRPTYFIKEFSQNYIGYFSPKYLFLSGGTQYQFSVPEWGLSPIINLPFFYIGILILLKAVIKGKNSSKFMLFWLLLAPIPAAITREPYAVVRSTTMLPVIDIVIVYGIISVHKALKKRSKKISRRGLYLYLSSLFVFVAFYMTNYFTEYRQNYSWSWQYGYKEAVEYTKENYYKYDKIIVTKKYGEPHEFYLFFWPWEPSSYKSDSNLRRFYQSDWYWVDSFGKLYFVNDWQIEEKEIGDYTFRLESKKIVHCTPRMFKCLLITSPGNVPEGWKKINEITFLDGQVAFEIYEN